MKKRYYFSMLSVLPLMVLLDSVYFFIHQSPGILFASIATRCIFFGLLNLIVSVVLYKPIDQIFGENKDTALAQKWIHRLTWYSAAWIFLLGIVHFAVLLWLLTALSVGRDIGAMERVPPILMISIVPAIVFFQAIFPAFISYFVINDFNLDLKAQVFSHSQIHFPIGKKKIGRTLLFVFIVLGFIPHLLVIVELVAVTRLGSEYAKFTNLNPFQTVFADRLGILVGMLIAVILITRSFTKPVYSLLKAINNVRAGDYSTQADIISEDEIGVLTHEFNEMVQGLKERELMRDTFGRYVTKEIASVILNKKINLEGEVRLCTILVTDIADYTAISEELTPKEIVIMLNEYFSELVNIIQIHSGIVNKFIGDSIFAVFNVPLDDPDHAVNAVNAALAIEKITMNRRFGKNCQLTTRIGINTGEVVAGTIGSADRMEYTVIGDDVNIAARLEQLNKHYNTRILLGENTFELAKNHFSFTELGNFQLKGKEKAIKVYKVATSTMKSMLPAV